MDLKVQKNYDYFNLKLTICIGVLSSFEKNIFMRNFILFFVVLFSFNFLHSQDFQGKAYYMSKTSFDLGSWGSTMSTEQKNQMKDRMKNMLEKTFILTFNKVESKFKEEERLGAPGQGRGWGSFGSSSSGPRYKNVKEKMSLEEIEFFGKKFLVSDDIDEIKWEMTNEQKKIGNYICFKAVAKKKAPFDWSGVFSPPRSRGNKPRGDKPKDSASKKPEVKTIDIPKTIDIVAWYAPQIPVSHGPAEYGGLPGLILELSTDQTILLCSKIVMNPEKKDEILMPTKGEKVTRNKYDEIVKLKTEEMKSMYQSRRMGSGRKH
jgi:GLPGLI family protein